MSSTRRTIVMLAAALLSALSLRAQTYVSAHEVELTRCGGYVQLTMNLSFEGPRPDKRQVVIVTPRLICGADSVELPSVGVYGRWTWYHYVRGGLSVLQGRDHIKLRGSRCPSTLLYVKAADYKPWMDRARLKLVLSDIGCCGTDDEEWLQQELEPGGTEPHLRQNAPTVVERTYRKRQRADITFVVNRTELLPHYRDNERQLERIRASIDSIRHDTAAVARSLTLKGYASPEASWQHNTELAKGRTEALRRYVASHYDVPDSIIVTDFQPEDWEGLRAYVVEHADEGHLPHARQIVELIDREMNPDRKLARIQGDYPSEYRYLLKNCFPQLRRSEYTIEYTRREQTVTPGTVDTTFALPAGQLMLMDYAQQRPYRPLLALKTNLLFDAALWGNAEVEVPLGRESRWSVMGEWGSPWFVWHHNSRAYEVLQVGLELRYWHSPRCLPCRPALTGSFVGVYAACGKYDLEWKSSGDQGEFVHAGFTLGHSWLLSRHWNLEVSLGVGALFGPRSHYNGEWHDTHLIWKYDKNVFYLGPTKLKVSIAWLMPDYFRRKGGVRR